MVKNDPATISLTRVYYPPPPPQKKNATQGNCPPLNTLQDKLDTFVTRNRIIWLQ